jgi:hypothetical protein
MIGWYSAARSCSRVHIHTDQRTIIIASSTRDQQHPQKKEQFSIPFSYYHIKNQKQARIKKRRLETKILAFTAFLLVGYIGGIRGRIENKSINMH